MLPVAIVLMYLRSAIIFIHGDKTCFIETALKPPSFFDKKSLFALLPLSDRLLCRL